MNFAWNQDKVRNEDEMRIDLEIILKLDMKIEMRIRLLM